LTELTLSRFGSGLCLVETAIVVAGFPYRQVGAARNCPECFSRPITEFAIRLNDGMPDDLRQELLVPFIGRLAGSADQASVETARCEFIVFETHRRIASRMCVDVLERPDFAKACQSANKAATVKRISGQILKVSGAQSSKAARLTREGAMYALVAARAPHEFSSTAMAGSAVSYFVDSVEAVKPGAGEQYFRLATGILDEAIQISGRLRHAA
jgi:hypothetical protein